MTGCRISKITNKATGRELRILPTNRSLQNDTVATLVEALAMARSGRMQAVAIVAVQEGGFIATSYSDNLPDHCYAGIAACEVLKKRLMEHIQ